MIVTSDLGQLTVVALVLALVLIAGAVADLVLWTLAHGRLPDNHGGLRRLVVVILALVGLFSVMGSMTQDEEAKNVLRVILGVTRGAGMVLVWALVIYDLVRYFETRQGRGTGNSA